MAATGPLKIEGWEYHYLELERILDEYSGDWDISELKTKLANVYAQKMGNYDELSKTVDSLIATIETSLTQTFSSLFRRKGSSLLIDLKAWKENIRIEMGLIEQKNAQVKAEALKMAKEDAEIGPPAEPESTAQVEDGASEPEPEMPPSPPTTPVGLEAQSPRARRQSITDLNSAHQISEEELVRRLAQEKVKMASSAAPVGLAVLLEEHEPAAPQDDEGVRTPPFSPNPERPLYSGQAQTADLDDYLARCLSGLVLDSSANYPVFPGAGFGFPSVDGLSPLMDATRVVARVGSNPWPTGLLDQPPPFVTMSRRAVAPTRSQGVSAIEPTLAVDAESAGEPLDDIIREQWKSLGREPDLRLDSLSEKEKLKIIEEQTRELNHRNNTQCDPARTSRIKKKQ